MLDRSIWDKMYKCLNLRYENLSASLEVYQKLDSLLKRKDVRCISFSIGEIEATKNRKFFIDEERWLKKKEEEYGYEIKTSTLHTNDPDSFTNCRTCVTNKGNISISPSEINKVMDKYNISKPNSKKFKNKRRDVHSLLIANKLGIDIFICNDKDYKTDSQIQAFIKGEGIKVEIVQLSDVISKIKELEQKGNKKNRMIASAQY